ncbi:MAG: phosphate ABC transporter substrate-binding protein [Blastocatellia bacterium]|nr:phosphate ABC transporter substrate-binding protein [Blastocatellia bacterium]
MTFGIIKKRVWILFFLALILSTVNSCSHSKVEIVTVKGSDTEVNLVQELAERFMENDPDISLTITGGGSGYGIASLINQKTDIANSSRPLNAKEKQLIEKQGIQVYPIIFAQDAIAVVVHPNTKITELSLEEVGKIFRGEIKNWKELGGADVLVSLYGRQSNSGTFVYFRERILKGEYDSSVKQMNGTAQLIEAVKQDSGGIGYVGIGYLINKKDEVSNTITAVKLREGEKEAVSPLNKEAIIEGRYPIIRPLFQFLNGKPQGKALEFLRYELSEEGQKIVAQNGYFEINQQQREQNNRLGLGF